MYPLFNYESDLRLLLPGHYVLDEIDARSHPGGSYLVIAKNNDNKTEFTDFFLTHDLVNGYITNIRSTSDATGFLTSFSSSLIRDYLRLSVTVTSDIKIKYYRFLVKIE